jgi:5-methylcytosine-specific restriction endonuclease McrA
MTPYQYARRIRSSHAWRQLSKRVITEERVCWLQLPGCTRIATTADHIHPITTHPHLALIRSNCHAACKSCNYRRGDTPVNQLDHLRHSTPTQLDEHRARRHIASRQRVTAKKAPALRLFDTTTPV